MTGRPTKLTDELRKKLTCDVENGVNPVTAANNHGVSERLFYMWMARGREEEEGEGDSSYIEFFQSIKKAQAEVKIERMGRIREAAKGGALVKRTTTTKKDGTETVTEQYAAPKWEADGWSQERDYPDEYGQRTRTDVTLREPVQVEFKIIDKKG